MQKSLVFIGLIGLGKSFFCVGGRSGLWLGLGLRPRLLRSWLGFEDFFGDFFDDFFRNFVSIFSTAY